VTESKPSLSVILATHDNFASIAATVRHLARQTAASAIELVIVAPDRSTLGADESLLACFGAVCVVEHPGAGSPSRYNAAGVRRATAMIIALTEDHCFPDPDWAERLIAAHRGPWAAVGPAVRNANPDSCASWADCLIGYGPWLEPVARGEVEFLPGHNCSYKRAILLEDEALLERWLEAETLWHWELRRRGERLLLEPAARVAHTNFSRWSSFLPANFYNGRLFAASRCRGMSPARRVTYVLLGPMIPLVRAARVARAVFRSPALVARFCLAMPALLVGLTCDGFGQMLGYAFGAGNAYRQAAAYEWRRDRHVTEHDRHRLLEAAAE
jgi:GT2 family glycosyltransferase